MEYLVEVENLRKQFENHLALKSLSIKIPKRQIFGLLGPNGAGKTTLIRHLTQIYLPDQGSISFKGEPLLPKHIKSIGYMPEERGLYKKMKVGEQLIYLARLKGLSHKETVNKVNYWLEHFGIEDWKEKPVEELSKGMQQKIQFISTILHEPDLLILDEPFSGLDPINANLIRDEILDLNRKGTTIIFSTHRMESVEELCEDIALINNGEIILQGNVKEIQQQFKQHIYEVELGSNETWPESLNEYPVLKQEEQSFHIQLSAEQSPSALLQQLLSAERSILSFKELLPSVNDIFIQQVQSGKHE